MSEFYDRKGIPILPGDLIRSDHFRDHRRRQYYLYHCVCMVDGVLTMIPTEQLATGKNLGGVCPVSVLAVDGVVRNAVVLAGDPYPDERKRRTPSLHTIAGEEKGSER